MLLLIVLLSDHHDRLEDTQPARSNGVVIKKILKREAKRKSTKKSLQRNDKDEKLNGGRKSEESSVRGKGKIRT